VLIKGIRLTRSYDKKVDFQKKLNFSYKNDIKKNGKILVIIKFNNLNNKNKPN